MAAIMVILEHTKSNLSFLHDTKSCLLARPDQFRKAVESDSRLEGCYLYYDGNDEKWVRSGKVCNHSFAKRHSEHVRCSKLEKPQICHHFFTHRIRLRRLHLLVENMRDEILSQSFNVLYLDLSAQTN